MHTVESRDDKTQRNELLFNVVVLDRWVPPDTDDDGKTRVYVECDAEWVRPAEVAEFDDMQQHLTIYRRAEEDPDNIACTILSDSAQAMPHYPVTDPRIPTLMLAWFLRSRNWDPVSALCKHDQAPTEDHRCAFDNRGGTKMKWYLMVLARLPQFLPLSSGLVPSQQPQGYYKLLLQGIKAEPGESAKQYALVHNRKLKGPDRAKEYIPIEEVDPPDDGDEFFVAPLGAAPRPEPRRGGAGGRGRGDGHGRGRGVDGGAHLAPPPPEPAPLPIASVAEEFFAAPLAPPGSGGAARAIARERQSYGGYVPALDGCSVSWQPATDTSGKPMWNWRLKCPFHPSCYKRRGCGPQFCRNFGKAEPLAFLHAWAHVPWPSADGKPTHALEMPSDQAVRDYAAAHLDELEDLLKLFE